MIRCPRCRKKFHPNLRLRANNQRFCTKSCKNAYYSVRYFSNHRERYLAYQRNYYQRHAEEHKAAVRARYARQKAEGTLPTKSRTKCKYKPCGAMFKPNTKPRAHNQKYCSQLCKSRHNRIRWYKRHKTYELDYRERYYYAHIEECRAAQRRYKGDRRWVFKSVPDTPTLYD